MGISYKKEIEFNEVIFIGFTNIATNKLMIWG